MVIKQREDGTLIVDASDKWVGPFSSYGEAQLWCECEGAEEIRNGGVMREDVEVEAPSSAAPATAKGKRKK